MWGQSIETVGGTTFVALDGFYPEDGNVATLSPTTFTATGFKNLDMQYQITPAQVQNVCTDFSVGAGKTLEPNLPGSFPASDGTRYVVGNNNVSSQIYLRGKPDAKGVCNLTSVASIPNVPILQAWKQADGKFLAQDLLEVSPMDGIFSEISLVRNGAVESRLVSTNTANNPAITATKCCQMYVDWSRNQSLVTYFADGGGGHAFVYNSDGVINPIYNNEDGLASNFMFDEVFGEPSLSDKWAVIGVSTNGVFRLLRINTETKEVTVIARVGDSLPGGMSFWMTNGVVSPDGTVFFPGYSTDGKTCKVYRAWVPGPPAFTKAEAEQPTITKGSSTSLTWCATDATTVSISGLGADAGTVIVPVCGSVVVSPTTTETYTLTAIGPLGSAHATVTVTVVPNPPQIEATTTIFGGTTTLKAAPGQIVTLWGTLCSNVPADTQWLPLQTAVGGCSAKFADIQGQNVTLGNLYYASARQINVQVPETTTLGTAQMVVTFNGLSSAPEFFQVVSTNPDYVVETVGTQAYLKGVHLNGSYTTASNPAVGGETILVFLSGLGSGTKIAITVNGIPATVYYAGPQGDYPGLDQINVQVPANVKYGTEYIVTATATDGTQKVDTLSTEPVLQ